MNRKEREKKINMLTLATLTIIFSSIFAVRVAIFIQTALIPEFITLYNSSEFFQGQIQGASIVIVGVIIYKLLSDFGLRRDFI